MPCVPVPSDEALLATVVALVSLIVTSAKTRNPKRRSAVILEDVMPTVKLLSTVAAGADVHCACTLIFKVRSGSVGQVLDVHINKQCGCQRLVLAREASNI